ncbi:hypothetical protein ACKKBG_A24470 [Auxenochlorella protothecoides x Auxenochlorella symbiontica]
MFTRVKCLETQATWDPPSESHGIPALDCIPHRKSRRTGAGQREQALTLPRDQACQIPACAQRPQPTQAPSHGHGR